VTVGTGTAGTAVTLSGAGAFSSGTSYDCFATDTSTAGGNVGITTITGTSFNAVTRPSGLDTYRYTCVGN